MNRDEQNYYQFQDAYQGQYQDSYQNQYQQPYTADRVIDLQEVMTKTFLGMFVLLLISAAAAFYMVRTDLVYLLVYNQTIFWGILIGELVLTFAATSAIAHNNLSLSIGLTVLYSVMTGVTLSIICLAYTASSIAYIFVLSALLFLATALFGMVTKKDLSVMGQIALMGILGLIIMGIFNLFFQSDMFANMLAIAGLALFIGLTAYDTQKIKRMAAVMGQTSQTSANVVAVYGAFSLYLDFINIFLKLLRLFGKRK